MAADKFRRALEAPSTPSRGVHPKMAKAARAAMAAQLEDLKRQIAAYEALQRGQPALDGSIEEFGGLLVYADRAEMERSSRSPIGLA